MKKLIVVLALALALGGCATGYDVKLNAADQKAVESGQKESAKIVKYQTDAIDKLKLPEGSDSIAMALMEVFKIQAIAGIKATHFKVEKARLNTDNVAEVGKTLRAGIPIIGMVRVTEVASL